MKFNDFQRTFPQCYHRRLLSHCCVWRWELKFRIIFHFSVKNISISIVLGNLAVMLTAVLTKELRTARNVFIFSLALSDFLLALTIPATVYDAVTTSWQMSSDVNLCRSGN